MVSVGSHSGPGRSGASAALPAMKADVKLSVVIPTYKERSRLPRTLREAQPYLLRTFRNFEILVVDDASPDGTLESVFEPASGLDPSLLGCVRPIAQGRRFGKGAAVRRGFEEASGDVIMFMDADHATRIENVDAALEPMLRGEADSMVGVRLVDNEEPMRRRVVSLGLLFLTHLVTFKKPVMDSQCGFKLFTRDLAKDLARYCRVDTGLIDVEMFTLMQKWGVRYGYVPVHWQNDEDSRIEVLRTMLRDLRVLVWIARNHRKGLYEQPMAPGERIWERVADGAAPAGLARPAMPVVPVAGE